jgi:hypothetical protein
VLIAELDHEDIAQGKGDQQAPVSEFAKPVIRAESLTERGRARQQPREVQRWVSRAGFLDSASGTRQG